MSLGSTESLTCLLTSSVHIDKYMSSEDRARGGVSSSLIRLRCVRLRQNENLCVRVCKGASRYVGVCASMCVIIIIITFI